MPLKKATEWREHPDFLGLYAFSTLGQIKSLAKKYKNCNKKTEKTLIPTIRKDGYLGISLCKEGIRRCFLVHRLIAETFISNPENKKEVNHKNGNKKDNRTENLEWVDRSENQLHAIKTGLKIMKKAQNHFCATISNEIALDIFNPKLDTQELMQKYGVSYSIVRKIKNGRLWRSITNKSYVAKKRLSDISVMEIFISELTYIELAKLYGISRSQVNAIKNGRSWKHITNNLKNAI